jgi:hypothetical protein
MHGGGFLILLFVITSLLIGALLKIFMRNSRLPYTVILLLVGIVAGDAIEDMVEKNCTQAFTRHINNKFPKLIIQLQSQSIRRLLLNLNSG